MHVMFIHPNFPGQFGHIAHHLAVKLRWPCTVVSSVDTSRLQLPVQEVIDDGVHGLLADFFDVDGLTRQATRVLRDPEGFRTLGLAARERVLERYAQQKCIDELVAYFGEVAGKHRGT